MVILSSKESECGVAKPVACSDVRALVSATSCPRHVAANVAVLRVRKQRRENSIGMPTCYFLTARLRLPCLGVGQARRKLRSRNKEGPVNGPPDAYIWLT